MYSTHNKWNEMIQSRFKSNGDLDLPITSWLTQCIADVMEVFSTRWHLSALGGDQCTDTCVSFDLSHEHYSVEAAKTVVRALVSSLLNYCSLLMFGISDSLLQRLHAVQNAAAAACLVTNTWWREYIMSILRQLHWLSVRQHIDFKLVYKALNGLSRSTWQITASLSLQPADNDFDRPTLLRARL